MITTCRQTEPGKPWERIAQHGDEAEWSVYITGLIGYPMKLRRFEQRSGTMPGVRIIELQRMTGEIERYRIYAR